MEQPLPGSSMLSESHFAELRVELARAVRQVCPAWLADRSEDLVQVALMRVLDVQKKSEGNVELSSFYLKKVARSALIDEIRRLRRRQEVALDDTMIESHPPAPAPDPERATAGRELGKAIQGCLERLIRPRRVAVTLHLLGHSVPEAAKLLGWSVKKAENLIYRGLTDLRACLERAGVAP